MSPKNAKVVEAHLRAELPAPIATAGFSAATMNALNQTAKRLAQVPARTFSKSEIEQFFKSI